MRDKMRLMACTALAVGVFMLTVICTLAFGTQANIKFGGVGSSGANRLSIAIVIGGSVVCFCLWVVVMAIFFRDYLDGVARSPLYMPLIVLATCLALYTAFAALQGLDLARHDYRVHWAPLYEPEVRLLQSALLMGVFGALAWLTFELVRGPRWSNNRLMVLSALAVMAAAMVALGAIGIFHFDP